MCEYKEKFIVINKKHLVEQKAHHVDLLREVIRKMNLPDNKYYVCNQDEPYAKDVIKTILEGEKNKLANQRG